MLLNCEAVKLKEHKQVAANVKNTETEILSIDSRDGDCVNSKYDKLV